ncbi:MAG TPA: hypothetical protein VHJ78_09080 [Actinomycetota bacterium]|nr:hypothetical protein [Actinomycetota bacterium]
MAQRHPQVVGSIPQPSVEQAVAWQLEKLPGLRYVSGGETGERQNWIMSFIESLREHPDLELRKEGRWSGYQDTPVLGVRRGHQLRGESMSLGTLERTREELQVLDRLAAADGEPATLLVGMPDYLNLALFSMGKLGPMRHGKAFFDLIVREITETQNEFGQRVIFQLEAPLQLVATAKAGPLAMPVAGIMAERLVKVARKVPAGTRFGVHLCLGDMNHEALTPLRSTAPVVHLFNALSSRWPATRPLEFIHAPLAGGTDPVPVDLGYFEPFSKLYRGPARFVAGVVQESQDLGEQAAALEMLESLIGPVDVATYCGLGRRSPEAAEEAAERTMRLVELSRLPAG